jgi:hypothetical protein
MTSLDIKITQINERKTAVKTLKKTYEKINQVPRQGH